MVSLVGAYNWWLPGWAARLLRVDPSPLGSHGPPFDQPVAVEVAPARA